jgi:hypothetical protein
MTKPPCERCGQPCRSDKPLYGWVCANCVYELDRHYVIVLGMTGGSLTLDRYISDRDAGNLPPPGPRGPGLNVRKHLGW